MVTCNQLPVFGEFMRSKASLLTLSACLICFSPLTAQAATSKELLIEAVKDGHAAGELTGDQADAWMAHTHSREPIRVEAKVVGKLQQQGCARVALQYRQEMVPKVNGGSGPLEVGWGMDICEDGAPPLNTGLVPEKQNLPSYDEQVISE